MATTRVELPTIKALTDDYCNDVKRLKIRAGIANPNVAPGSETAIKGEATASLAFQLYAEIAATQDSTMPDSSTGDDLTRYAKVKFDMDPSLGAGAYGKVIAECTGVVVYPKDLEGKSPDGLRYRVATSVAVVNGGSIPIAGIDTGKRTDKAAGTVITWTSPPGGSAPSAKVDASWLTGGIDPDNDERLRSRLQDKIRHPAKSGAWAHYAEWAETNAATEKAFVYPAARGPSTLNVAFSVVADRDNTTGAYTRQAPAALVNDVATYIVGQDPEHADVLTTTVADEACHVYLRVGLPLPAGETTGGGPGGGWKDTDTYRWPAAVAPYSTPTHLEIAPTTPLTIQVDCVGAANTPKAEAQIAIWSTSHKKFVHTKIKTVTLSAGTVYDLVLYFPVDTSILAPGDPISPDADSLDDYGQTIAEQFASLGPGELTSLATLLPRSYRHPSSTESWKSMLTSEHIGALSSLHPEVYHVSCDAPALPKSPTVAATTSSAPNVLVLGKLAIYKV